MKSDTFFSPGRELHVFEQTSNLLINLPSPNLPPSEPAISNLHDLHALGGGRDAYSTQPTAPTPDSHRGGFDITRVC